MKNLKTKSEYFNGHETHIVWGGGNGESQQIDGFFVINNIVFICEATLTESLGDKIDDFAHWKRKLIDEGIESFISSEPDIVFKDMQIVWLLFSKNETTPANEKKASKNDIKIVYENDIDYMVEVLSRYAKENMYELAFTSFIASVLQLDSSKMMLKYLLLNILMILRSNAFVIQLYVIQKILDRCLVVHRRSDQQQDSYQDLLILKLSKVAKFIKEINLLII